MSPVMMNVSGSPFDSAANTVVSSVFGRQLAKIARSSGSAICADTVRIAASTALLVKRRSAFGGLRSGVSARYALAGYVAA